MPKRLGNAGESNRNLCDAEFSLPYIPLHTPASHRFFCVFGRRRIRLLCRKCRLATLGAVPAGLGWVEAWSPDTPIQSGEVVAVMGRAIGMWWLNACRIVYAVDESGPISKFGFAYGTVPGHVESGEERFLIEWDQKTDSVSYDILAFSKPNHFLTRLGYPVVRRMQQRFGRDSAAAMLLAARPILGERSSQPMAGTT